MEMCKSRRLAVVWGGNQNFEPYIIKKRIDNA